MSKVAGAPSPATLARGEAAPGLRRSLTLWHAVLYGLGVTIGAGIYVLIAPAAAQAGMSAPLAFALAAAVMGLTAASFAELACRMPVAAGEAAYASAGFRSKLAGTAVGLLVIAVAVGSGAAISIGAAGYIRAIFPAPEALVVTLVVLAMGAIAAWGIVESVTFAAIMTLIEVAGLLIIVAAGLLSGPETVTRLPEMIPPLSDAAAWSGLMTAGLLAVFAFIGFEGIVNVAEELKEPTRNLPRAIFITLALSALLYVLVVWVSVVAVAPAELARTKAPLALVFERLTGLSHRHMSAIAIVATLNGIIVQIILAARVAYGLARVGGLPSWLGRVSPWTRTPLIGTGLATVTILALALALPLEGLAEASSRLTLALFGLVNLALALLKRRETTPSAGIFVVPAAVPYAGCAVSFLFLVADLAL